jgi:hypothetical protein
MRKGGRHKGGCFRRMDIRSDNAAEKAVKRYGKKMLSLSLNLFTI